MDIDNDIDLISQFRTMNTNDKDQLIADFKRLSNTQLSNEGCCFFLDLAEWNLNTALWAYYEYDAPIDALNNLPQMKFLCDITIGEGESVGPNTKFIKTWRIKNTGPKRWPYGCQLRLVNTNITSNTTSPYSSHDSPIHVNALEPDDTSDVSVHLQSPAACGIYQSQYRLFTPTNTPFGDPIWLVLNVELGGVLGITQQLNSVSMFGISNSNNHNNNNNTSAGIPSASSSSSSSSSSTNSFMNQFSPTSPGSNSSSFKSTTTRGLFQHVTPLNIINNNNNNNPLETTTNFLNSDGTTDTNSSKLSEQQVGTSGNNSHLVNLTNQLVDEEKRPDFYDDMFS